MGIFSRSTLFDSGISKGSWLPYIERALAIDYGVLLLRPNTNFITQAVDGEKPEKIAIKGSESPEIHALNVWENIIPKAEQVTHIALLGFGHGASLCKDLFLRELANINEPDKDVKIKAFITIAASHIVEKDDDADTKTLLGKIAINMEANPAPIGHLLDYKKEQLGCTTLSLGLPAGVSEVRNDAVGVSIGIDAVFKYLLAAEAGGSVSKRFATELYTANGLTATSASIPQNPYATEDVFSPSPAATPPPAPSPPRGIFSRMFGSSNSLSSDNKKDGSVTEATDKLTVADFDLLKIVGKGAFGKVMLVRKKASQDSGKIYAMKVLKKSVVAAKGQIEHTKSERDILFEVKHP